MARRRGLEKMDAAPVLEPQGPVGLEGEAEGMSLLFGTRRNQKSILIGSIVTFVLVGVIHFIIANNEGQAFTGKSVVPLFFSALFGGLSAMLVGQLILVYSDAIMVIFTLATVLLGEGAILVGMGVFDTGFKFQVGTFDAIVGVFFLSGFVGFWLGFIAFAKHLKQRRRFQGRYQGPDQTLPNA